jgi:transposase InsO family protein
MTAILQRHGQIAPEAAPQHTAWQRFEHDAPNRLWQMDFKGHFALLAGRCHPLTVLDDHSRFAVGLQACGDQTGQTVQARLTACLRRYGLPEAILVDNGPPWGSDAEHPHTPLTAWLIRLGVRILHTRPYHPQTQGKDERFHRTLKAEVLGTRVLRDLAHCQREFDRWREVYNLQRPHEALAMAVPASRYRVSPRAFPEVLPPIEYGPADLVRKVAEGGELSYRSRPFRVGKAFCGYPVALRPTLVDGVLDVFFCHQRVAQVNLRNQEELH